MIASTSAILIPVAFATKIKMSFALTIKQLLIILSQIIKQLHSEKDKKGIVYFSSLSVTSGTETVNGEHHIPFKLRANDPNQYKKGMRDSYTGNVVIGTIHTHRDKKGLSGLRSEDDLRHGSGDVSQVKAMEVPWYTLGPGTTIHVGYMQNSKIQHTKVEGKNLLKDALQRIQKR